MSERNKSILAFVILLSLLVMVMLLCPLPSKPAEQPQIVLVYRGMHPDGKTRIFVPQTKIALGLTPMDNYASMNPGSYTVCKMEVTQLGVRTYSGKETDKMNEILFRCGQDRYLFTVLAVNR
jgi:hypothetical protein